MLEPLTDKKIEFTSQSGLATKLARRIRSRRLEKGWSQAEMAERAGIRPATYILFERTGKISLLRLIKLLDVLGVASQVDLMATGEDYTTKTVEDILQPERRRGRRRSR